MKDIFDFRKWDMGTWGGIILIFFIFYISIVSVIGMSNRHEVNMAKINCQNVSEVIK